MTAYTPCLVCNRPSNSAYKVLDNYKYCYGDFCSYDCSCNYLMNGTNWDDSRIIDALSCMKFYYEVNGITRLQLDAFVHKEFNVSFVKQGSICEDNKRKRYEVRKASKAKKQNRSTALSKFFKTE